MSELKFTMISVLRVFDFEKESIIYGYYFVPVSSHSPFLG